MGPVCPSVCGGTTNDTQSRGQPIPEAVNSGGNLRKNNMESIPEAVNSGKNLMKNNMESIDTT